MYSDATPTTFLLIVCVLLLNACSQGYYTQSNPNYSVKSTESGKPMPEGTRSWVGSAHSMVYGDNYLYLPDRDSESMGQDRTGDYEIGPAIFSISIEGKFQIKELESIGIGVSLSGHRDPFVPNRYLHENLTVSLSNTLYRPIAMSNFVALNLMIAGSSMSQKRTLYTRDFGSNSPLEIRSANPRSQIVIEMLAEPILFHSISSSTGLTLAPQLHTSTLGRRWHARTGFRAALVFEPSKNVRWFASTNFSSKSWLVSIRPLKPTRFGYPYPESLKENATTSMYQNLSVGVQFLLDP